MARNALHKRNPPDVECQAMDTAGDIWQGDPCLAWGGDLGVKCRADDDRY